MAAKLKTGDRVVVLAGRDKGKEGEIVRVMPKEGRAIVAGVNMVVRHERQTQSTQGGRIPKEAPIQISNLAYLDSNDKPTRVGFRTEDGKKVRFAKTTGETIDG
ncbi:MAG: 50S ribosomal protein L24 [Pseudomonadota bacterium]